MRSDIYIAGSVACDGPIPGPFSMIGFGLVVAGIYDGERYVERDPRETTFAREVQPISGRSSVAEAFATGMDRNRLEREGVEAHEAMLEAAEWVYQVAGINRPVLVGFPLGRSWMFLQWYFTHFSGGAPFGEGAGLDCQTLFQVAAKATSGEVLRDPVVKYLAGPGKGADLVLEQAIGVAEMFSLLFGFDENSPREQLEALRQRLAGIKPTERIGKAVVRRKA